MPPVEFEPTISIGKRPQTYALDRLHTKFNRIPEEFCSILKAASQCNGTDDDDDDDDDGDDITTATCTHSAADRLSCLQA